MSLFAGEKMEAGKIANEKREETPGGEKSC